MNDKYLVLMINKSYFFKYVSDKNVYKIYTDNNKFEIYLRKFFSRVFQPILPFFYGKWKQKISSVDTIIIFDNGYRKVLTKFIKKINPKIKIIFYFWNILNKKNKEVLKDKNIDEIWTFDKGDSQKYNFNYFPQFYDFKIVEMYSGNDLIKNDVFFIGAVKDRKNILNNIKRMLFDCDNKLKLKIETLSKSKYTYEEYLTCMIQSKVLLDVIGKKQTGLTLRTLESQFFEKKLITNNKDIINYDFYNEENIFIVGIHNESRLKEFIDLPFKNNDNNKILEKYSYDNFIKTILEKKDKEIIYD